ncbi:hypothetical protein EV174_004776 [Coemansia sp. RSA 2320]|nr:hypothetical protein EV174_004776 [Coemansia sp. RSA 2320]
MVEGAGITGAGMVEGAGITGAGMVDGAGITGAGMVDGAGITGAGMVEGAGITGAGMVDGAGITGAGMVDGAGITGAGMVEGAGITGAGTEGATGAALVGVGSDGVSGVGTGAVEVGAVAVAVGQDLLYPGVLCLDLDDVTGPLGMGIIGTQGSGCDGDALGAGLADTRCSLQPLLPPGPLTATSGHAVASSSRLPNNSGSNARSRTPPLAGKAALSEAEITEIVINL